ncbi:MAG: dTDP-4-keto-6-deoxy-D-glucose epimerase [Planctomycetota bacterium]|nr:MAG: dTDP-4-keto-6-deoxy-D-glucose epimerase [Planctomycetota bacterium]
MPGVRRVALTAHRDERGAFLETFRQEWFPGRPPMVQANRSESRAGVLRGLHFHLRQADYWHLPRGRVFVALADLRRDSPAFGRAAWFELDEERPEGLYVPPGVAHGFCALTDATLTYQVDRTYDPADEHGLAWDDPDLAIPWPVPRPTLSARDRANPRLADLPVESLPRYEA